MSICLRDVFQCLPLSGPSFYPCPETKDPSPILGIIVVDRHQAIEELNFARDFSETSLHKLCKVRVVAVIVEREDKPQPLTQRPFEKHRPQERCSKSIVVNNIAGFNRFHVVVKPECGGHERQNSQPEDRPA